MTHRTVRVLVLCCAALAVSCGGNDTPTGPTGGPASPPTSAPAPLSIVDGVSGAPVTISGAPAAPAPGAELALQVPGYLPRRQRFDGQPVALWPGDQSYVDALVYGVAFNDGSHRLTRWAGAFIVTLDSDVAADPHVVRAAEEAVTEVRRTTGLAVTLGAGGPVAVRVDPADPMFAGPAIAYARCRYQGANLVGCDIVFEDRREIAGRPGAASHNALLHEMGHALGLGHSPSGNDVMDPGGGRSGQQRTTFSDNEAAVLRMMYVHRRAGNRQPDADPGFFAAAVRVHETVIVD